MIKGPRKPSWPVNGGTDSERKQRKGGGERTSGREA